MSNIENDSVTRFEIGGMMCGALVGAALSVWQWYAWGQFHPELALAWGLPLPALAWVTGFIGAVIGIVVGNTLRHSLRKGQAIKVRR
jgi:hypothetical protein